MSLTERLRLAALERARVSGQKVDDYVLEPTGVIDLREMERETSPAVDNRVTLPALGRDAHVDDLYARPLSETRLWKRVRGTMTPAEETVESEVDATEARTADEITIDLTEDVPLIELDHANSDIDAALSAQPTRPCQRCGNAAQRDLIDIFNSIEYFSCDDCGHMWQQAKG